MHCNIYTHTSLPDASPYLLHRTVTYSEYHFLYVQWYNRIKFHLTIQWHLRYLNFILVEITISHFVIQYGLHTSIDLKYYLKYLKTFTQFLLILYLSFFFHIVWKI